MYNEFRQQMRWTKDGFKRLQKSIKENFRTMWDIINKLDGQTYGVYELANDLSEEGSIDNTDEFMEASLGKDYEMLLKYEDAIAELRNGINKMSWLLK